MAPFIVSASIAFILFLISTILDQDDDGKVATFMIAAVILIGLTVGFCLTDQAGTYQDGQVDALKGIQTYEIHYVYPKGDTIPSDTLYLEINP